ncbi:MAG: hypothetical protein GY755_09620 [Chloroflexi bacterium]|nr:hypothetical protein [Chloroflexota bacterium]
MSRKTIYQKATTKTAHNLHSVAESESLRKLSHLSLPEIEAAVELVSQIVPAGNVPGMILSGLARLPAQRIPSQTIQQHINALYSGVEQVLDQVTFRTVFAGPAAVIWGYQNLLKLAGKDPDSAFPDGVWQFYVDYALREDTARHANETHGFDTLLVQHGIRLSRIDHLTALVMAAISSIHQYDALLEVEWRERTSISILSELTASLPDAHQYTNIYREWELQRPYRRGAEAASHDYPDYRRIRFKRFIDDILRDLPTNLINEWKRRLQATEKDLSEYQRQMSIFSYLEPGPYGEIHIPYSYEQAKIALILHGQYYLLPIYNPESDQPLDAETVRSQIAALWDTPSSGSPSLIELAITQRAAQSKLRDKLSPNLRGALEKLRYAPIFINADRRLDHLPLTQIRQAERGIGDHALTIFETGKTLVFDQSHIFFDGILGSALAEIMTNEALSWASYLDTLPDARVAEKKLYAPLAFKFTNKDRKLIQKAPRVTPESGAETNQINLKACLQVRKSFRQRSEMLHLTVNDLLVLYRAIHAANYKPSQKLIDQLHLLASKRATRSLAADIVEMLKKSRRQNPAVLIPMDASRHSPRERIYPLSVEIPLRELDLLRLHRLSVVTLENYKKAQGDRTDEFIVFDRAQKKYLGALAGLGMILKKLKEIALQGESTSVGAIKLLAHLPAVLQHMLDQVPVRFELLNNILKGREVFSNVGAVVPNSTLKRFVTAKDDNEQKMLVWGVITDADGIMRISLRDFRPHVEALFALGQQDLAQAITQDYLDSYAQGFNAFIRDLQNITALSRETILAQRAPTVLSKGNLSELASQKTTPRKK